MHSEEEISKAVDGILNAISRGSFENNSTFVNGVNLISLAFDKQLNDAQLKSLRQHPIEILTELNLLRTPEQIKLGKRILIVHFLLGHCFREAVGKSRSSKVKLLAFPAEKAPLNKLEDFLKTHLPQEFERFSKYDIVEIRYFFSKDYNQIMQKVKLAIKQTLKELSVAKREVLSHQRETPREFVERLQSGRKLNPKNRSKLFKRNPRL